MNRFILALLILSVSILNNTMANPVPETKNKNGKFQDSNELDLQKRENYI